MYVLSFSFIDSRSSNLNIQKCCYASRRDSVRYRFINTSQFLSNARIGALIRRPAHKHPVAFRHKCFTSGTINPVLI